MLITWLPAAEQAERAVGVDRGHVAGERVPHAVDDPERRAPTSPGPCSSRAARCRRRPPCRPRPSRAATSRSSSVNTFVVGIWREPGRRRRQPLIVMLTPHRALGRARWRRSASPARCARAAASLTSAVHITPDEMIVVSDDVSYGVPRSVGRVERPDDRLGERVADDARSRSPVALHRRQQLVRVERSALERDDRPAGEVGDEARRATRRCRASAGRPGSRSAGRRVDGLRRSRRSRPRRSGGARPSSGKPPSTNAVRDPAHGVHHALGHAGRAAGVEHVDVVLARARSAPSARGRRCSSSYAHGASDACAVRPAVVDGDEQLAASGAARRRGRHGRRATCGTPAPRRRRCRAGTTARRRGSGSSR